MSKRFVTSETLTDVFNKSCVPTTGGNLSSLMRVHFNCFFVHTQLRMADNGKVTSDAYEAYQNI